MSPKVVAPGCSAISSARRALTPSRAARVDQIDATASSIGADIGRGTPSASGRMISTWLIGMPPADLRAVLGQGRGEEKLLDLAEAALALETLRPKLHLAKRLDGGCKPREAVGDVLGRIDTAGRLHLCLHTRFCSRQNFVGGADDGGCRRDQSFSASGEGVGGWLRVRNRHGVLLKKSGSRR